MPDRGPAEAAVDEVDPAPVCALARPVDGGRVAADNEARLAVVLAGGAGSARGDRDGDGEGGQRDLLRMARRGRMLDWAGESQYYVEPEGLARLGYLQARKEPGRTRERTVYTLTDQGLDALGAVGAGRPCTSPRSRAKPCCACWSPTSSASRRRGRMATLRDDIADLLVRLDETEAAAETLPHRRKYLLLVTGFMRRLSSCTSTSSTRSSANSTAPRT